jgi:hypothetical protein
VEAGLPRARPCRRPWPGFGLGSRLVGNGSGGRAERSSCSPTGPSPCSRSAHQQPAMALDPAGAGPESRAMIERWGVLHAGRTGWACGLPVVPVGALG